MPSPAEEELAGLGTRWQQGREHAALPPAHLPLSEGEKLLGEHPGGRAQIWLLPQPIQWLQALQASSTSSLPHQKKKETLRPENLYQVFWNARFFSALDSLLQLRTPSISVVVSEAESYFSFLQLEGYQINYP